VNAIMHFQIPACSLLRHSGTHQKCHRKLYSRNQYYVLTYKYINGYSYG